MTAESDRLLVQHIRAGGPPAGAAWAALVDRYEGRLRAYVRRRLRDHAVTDDVVQETFVGFLRSLPNYDDARDLQTWLFAIADRKAIDQLRAVGRRPWAAGADGDAERLARAPDGRLGTASSAARSRERMELEADAVARGLRDVLRGFRERGDYRRVMALELLFVKGWANRRVAAHLGLTDQQVANYRFAAVQKLKDAVAAAGLSADVFPELADAAG